MCGHNPCANKDGMMQDHRGCDVPASNQSIAFRGLATCLLFAGLVLHPAPVRADTLTLTCDVDWKSIVVVAKARSVTPFPEQITITIDGNKATITKSDGHLIAEVPAAWHDQDISLGNPSPAVWGSFEHNINGLSGRITEFAKTEELDRLVMQTMDGYCLKLDAKRIS